MDPNTTPEPPAEAPVEPPQMPLNDQPLYSPNSEPPRPRRKWLPVLVGLFVLLVAAGGWFLWPSQKAAAPAMPEASKPTVTAAENKYCYLRLGYLYCVDADGKAQVRYDLPMLDGATLGTVSPQAGQKQFIATADASADEGTAGRLWLLDASLRNPKEVKLPANSSAQSPSFSRDGKSLLLEMDDNVSAHANNRHIYRYDLSDGKLTKLTTTGFASSPYETKDNRILYSYYDGKADGWSPYIMNADGTHAMPLLNAPALIADEFSYDTASDTVYVSAHQTGATGSVLLYGTPDYLLSGKTDHLVKLANGVGQAVPVADHAVMAQYDPNGKIDMLDLITGKTTTLVNFSGTMVGKLDTVHFTKAKQQTEGKYERIIGLNKTPADYQTFIKTYFDKQDASCTAGQPPAEFGIRVEAVADNAYVRESEGCADGTTAFYAKTAGGWKQVATSQMSLDCKTVNAYKLPKSIVESCTDAKGDAQPNANQ